MRLLNLQPVPSNARVARDWVLGELHEATADMRTTVQLVVSELATNAIVHSGTAFDVMIDVALGRVRVAVEDRTQMPAVVPTSTPEATSGRGLEIVAALADRWGVEQASCGKTVWAEFAR